MSDLGPVPLALLPPAWLEHATSQNGTGPDTSYELPERIPHGQQWSYLVSLAGTLRKRGLTEVELLTTLRKVHERCERPGPDENLVKLAHSATQWEPDSGKAFSPSKRTEKFRMSVFRPERVRSPRWAFDGWVLIGALNALVGAGGVGKSTLVSWMISGWTRGGLGGHFHGDPVNVLVVGDEDDQDEIWTPKIMAMGGDVERVYGLEYAQGVPFEMVEDIGALEEYVREYEIQVIYLDQVLDNLGGDLNANLPKDVRHGLAPMKSLARRLGRAVLYTMHPIKARGELSLRDRAGGSHQFTDLPRVGMFLGYHPEEEGRRALARGKGNVGETPEAITFEIEGTFIQNPETGKPVETVAIANLGTEPELTIDQVSVNPPRQRESKREKAVELLVAFGGDEEWHSRKAAEEMCARAGVSKRLFRDAFDELSKETRRNGRETEWKLKPIGATDAN